MIDLDENTCRQLVDKILSIASNCCNENLHIENYIDLLIVTSTYEICRVSQKMYFTSAKDILQCMMKNPLRFHSKNEYVSFDLTKTLGSTIEEIIISCDLKA